MRPACLTGQSLSEPGKSVAAFAYCTNTRHKPRLNTTILVQREEDNKAPYAAAKSPPRLVVFLAPQMNRWNEKFTDGAFGARQNDSFRNFVFCHLSCRLFRVHTDTSIVFLSSDLQHTEYSCVPNSSYQPPTSRPPPPHPNQSDEYPLPVRRVGSPTSISYISGASSLPVDTSQILLARFSGDPPTPYPGFPSISVDVDEAL